MDTVVFDGKEYVKASVLAERFRYTQDYLGQLCRGKKVDARLVGRAWYLNLASLEEHRTGRYKVPAKSPETTPQKPASNYLSRIDVEPVLKNKTVKLFKQKGGVLTELPVRYEQDEYSLIPRVNKTAVSTSIPILPADAEHLKIKKEAKKFNIVDFRAEPLPEVFLAGSIKVNGIPEAMEEVLPEQEKSEPADIPKEIRPELKSEVPNKRIISIRQPLKKVSPKPHFDMGFVPIKREINLPPIAKAPQEVPMKVVDERIMVRKEVAHVRKVEHRPIEAIVPKHAKVISREIKFSPDIVVPQKKSSKQTSFVSNLSLAVAVFLCATFVSVVILVANREVYVEGGSYADNLTFNMANLQTIFHSLRP